MFSFDLFVMFKFVFEFYYFYIFDEIDFIKFIILLINISIELFVKVRMMNGIIIFNNFDEKLLVLRKCGCVIYSDGFEVG